MQLSPQCRWFCPGSWLATFGMEQTSLTVNTPWAYKTVESLSLKVSLACVPKKQECGAHMRRRRGDGEIRTSPSSLNISICPAQIYSSSVEHFLPAAAGRMSA